VFDEHVQVAVKFRRNCGIACRKKRKDAGNYDARRASREKARTAATWGAERGAERVVRISCTNIVTRTRGDPCERDAL